MILDVKGEAAHQDWVLDHLVHPTHLGEGSDNLIFPEGPGRPVINTNNPRLAKWKRLMINYTAPQHQAETFL